MSVITKIPSLTLNNGVPLPQIGLGTYAVKESGGREVMAQAVYDAISLGVRHIDTAWSYNVETNVGIGIKRAIADGLVSRQDLMIVSKIWVTNMRRDRLLAQAEESRERLGLEYVDLLLIHWPCPLDDGGAISSDFPSDDGGLTFRHDDGCDLYNETWRAMEELVDRGFAKSIGVSNFTPDMMDKVMEIARIKPVVNQVESNPLLPNNKILDVCKRHKIVMTAYQALGGSWMGTDAADNLFNSPVIRKLAEKHKKTPAQILIRYHVDRGAAVVVKSITKSRIAENIHVFDFEFSPEDMAKMAKMESGQRNCFLPQLAGSKYDPFDY